MQTQTLGIGKVAALLVIGVMLGAGLVFGAFYAAGSLAPKTMIGTATEIVTSTLTTTINYAQAASWERGADYPLQVASSSGVLGQQCINSTAYVYCIGGKDTSSSPRNEVYSSSFIASSSGNITGWTLDSSAYPRTIYDQSCVASSGYVYCVGGTYDDVGDDTSSSYYAPLGGDGVVGAWSPTESFPIPVNSQSCTAWSGYIYCVGGFGEAQGTNKTSFLSNFVYYAALSSSGIGPWSKSTSYPENVFLPSCIAADGFIFCVGGFNSVGNAVSTDYYSPISSGGVGTWVQTSAYPVAAEGQTCSASSGYIYCVGGSGAGSYLDAFYYAAVSSKGIGGWAQATNYPQSALTDCVASSGYLYCVGGANGSAKYGATYYVSLEPLTSTTTTG